MHFLNKNKWTREQSKPKKALGWEDDIKVFKYLICV